MSPHLAAVCTTLELSAVQYSLVLMLLLASMTAIMALWLRARGRASKAAAAFVQADSTRRLLLQSIEATTATFAAFSPAGELLAWNNSYAKLHEHAFRTLPRPLQYIDLMRVAVSLTMAPGEVEEEVARRVQHHFDGNDQTFERLYPSGRWMSVTRRRLPGGEIAGFALDITTLKQREARIAESEARYRALVDTASVGIWHLNRAGRTVFANDRLASLFGGFVPVELAGSGLAPGASRLDSDPFGFTPGREVEAALRMESGRLIHLLIAASGWVPGHAGELGCVLTLLDITPLKAAQARVEHLAQHDPLTGLGNRAFFDEQMIAALRSLDGCTLMLIDLDHFKAANDQHGHAAGDEILRIAAQRMIAAVRPADVICRLGGDEFAAIIAHWNKDEAEVVGRRLVRDLSQPYQVGTVTIGLSASIGIAGSATLATSKDRLVHAADLALYHVKQEGRAGVACFRDEIEEAFSRRKVIQEELEFAPARDEFRLEFQPQVNISTGCVDTVEALLRWRNARLGRDLTPAEFLPVAATAGLLPAIDTWVLDNALAQIGAWRDWQRSPQVLAINISVESLIDPDFTGRVAVALRQHGVEPRRLEVEVPEDITSFDLDTVAVTLQELRNLGVQLALDDVGGGLSSFAHIVHLPVHRLKLDRAIIAGGLPPDSKQMAILRGILGVARSMALPVVVEGVESEEQLEALRAEGCEIVQGFLTGRPMLPGDLHALMAQLELAGV